MTVTVYRSTDGSAPVLTGSVGTLLTVFDAVLVNGYGSQSAAGWTKPYSNSGNIGCYRNSAVDGTGYCLNVNDAGPGAGGAREARLTGFQTMSALSTGTFPFPTYAQLGIGIGAVVCRKSTTADATARAWTIIADDTVFYLFTESGDWVSPTLTYAIMFGDIFSYKLNDVNRCIIIGRNIENSNSYTNEPFSGLHSAANLTSLSTTMIGHYMAGHYSGVGGSLNVSKHVDMSKFGLGMSGQASSWGNQNFGGGAPYQGLGYSVYPGSCLPYPNPPDNGLYLSPIWIHHSGYVRGYFKGLWNPCHHLPLSHNDTYSGTGNLAGKSFLNQSIVTVAGSGVAGPGQVHIETSSTWS